MENFWRDVWKLPNVITLTRLLFGALVTIILYHNGFEYAWVIFLLFVATDWFDGFVARLQKNVTSLGMFLDPLADQFLVLPIIWYLWWIAAPMGNEPMIINVPLFFTFREVVMLVIRLSAKKDIPAMAMSKYKIAMEYTGVFLFLLIGNLYYLAATAIMAAMLLALWSLLRYVQISVEGSYENHSA